MIDFLYKQNDTMEILGHQKVFAADSPESRQIKDIIAAYANVNQTGITQAVMKMFEKGVLFNFLTDIHNLGVINGKRELRAKKQKSPLNNHRN